MDTIKFTIERVSNGIIITSPEGDKAVATETKEILSEISHIIDEMVGEYGAIAIVNLSRTTTDESKKVEMEKLRALEDERKSRPACGGAY